MEDIKQVVEIEFKETGVNELTASIQEQKDITIEFQKELDVLEKKLKDTPKNSLSEQKALKTQIEGLKDAIKDQNLAVKDLSNQKAKAIAVEKESASATKASDVAMKSLDATFEEVYGDLKPLTTRMGEAEDRLYELALAGGTATQEYKDLLSTVANYRKTQIATDQTVDAAATTLGQKFGGAAQIAATGVQGVTAGMALFGDQSEETEKALLKVQAAMAFADAISSVSSLGGQFRVFKGIVVSAFASITAAKQAEIAVTNEATVAQNRLNLSVLKNPYVIAAAAIAALAVGIYAWVKANGEAVKQEKKVSDALDFNRNATKKLTDSIEENAKAASTSNDIEVLRARAYGATDKEIQALIKSQKELAVATAGTQSKESYNNLLKANAVYWKAVKTGNQDLIDSAKDGQREAQDLYKQSNEAYNVAIVDNVKSNLEAVISTNAVAKSEAEKAEAEAQKRREKAREEAEKDRDNKKKLEEEADADFRAFQKKVIDAEIEQRIIDKELKEKNRQEDLDSLTVFNDELIKREQKLADDQKLIDERVLAQKTALEQAKSSLYDKGLALLSSVFAKNKVLQKGIIIAESALGIGRSIVASQTANATTIAEGSALAIPTGGASLVTAGGLVTANNINTGIGIAANIAATSKALSTVGGGGGGSSSGGATATATATPTRNVAQVGFQGSSENQISTAVAKQQKDQPPIQAFVVSQALTNQQELDRKKELVNSF